MNNRNYINITSETAMDIIRKYNNILILDVRSKEEFDRGHIPGSINIPVNKLEQTLNKINDYREKPILVYCASGGRSPVAVRILLSNGFSNIYHLFRGFHSWKYPIER